MTIATNWAPINAAAAYREAFLDALQPPPDMTVSQWADAERWLPRRSTAEHGPWRTDRTPFLREPMDLLSPSETRIKRVVLVFGSQIGGKTEAGLNWLGSTIVLNPTPFLIMFPTETFAKRQVRQRLTPLFNNTPSIKERQMSIKSRDAANTMFLKEFAGDMIISIIGGNSGSASQGMPAGCLWVDELSSLPNEADDKGDPLENAEARLTNFPNRKTLLTSTPGVRGACRITWEFEERSDRRRYAVPMPCCGERQVLNWRQHFVWDTPRGEVFCRCEHCQERVSEHHKDGMLAGGAWRATAKGDGETAGFHLPGWYAPAGWLGWDQIRSEFLRAKGDPLLLKGWINKRAAEAFQDESIAEVNAEGLLKRAQLEPYPTGYCPPGVLLLTCSVDVQDTWLEVAVWGFGRDRERWLIWHEKITGDPAQNVECRPDLGGPWLQVNAIRRTQFNADDSGHFEILRTGVDSGGHFTHEVYEYCRLHARENVVAISGANRPTAPPVSAGKKMDVNYKNKVIKSGVTLYQLGVYSLKRTLYRQLLIDTPGPGFVHFGQNATSEFLKGLTCERLVPKTVKGFQKFEWHNPPGARNEPLDTAVYCAALVDLVSREYARGTMWDQLEAQALARQKGSTGDEPSPLLKGLRFG